MEAEKKTKEIWLYYTNQFTHRHDYINRAMNRNTLMDEYRTISRSYQNREPAVIVLYPRIIEGID